MCLYLSFVRYQDVDYAHCLASHVAALALQAVKAPCARIPVVLLKLPNTYTTNTIVTIHEQVSITTYCDLQ